MQVQLTDGLESADRSPNSGLPPEKAAPAKADCNGLEMDLSSHPVLGGGKLRMTFKTLPLCSRFTTGLATKRRFSPVHRSILEKSELRHGQEREQPYPSLSWPETIPGSMNGPSAFRELRTDGSLSNHRELDGGVSEVS
jgi:hypothetical protein